MRERNLAVSENICNFVLGKSSIFVSMIFVSVFDVCVAQNRVNGTFNTVGYVANNPKVYVLPEDSISTDGDEDVEATKEQSLDYTNKCNKEPYIQCVIPIEGYLDYLSIWDTEGSDE